MSRRVSVRLSLLAVAGLALVGCPHQVHAQCWPPDGFAPPCCPCPLFAPPCFAPVPVLLPSTPAKPSPRPEPEQGAENAQSGRVRILLLGLTGDREVGDGVKKDLEVMKETLEAGIPADRRGDTRILSGKELTAANILAEVDKMEVQAGDTLLCYYSGPGAYNPDRAAGDPSAGHFFYIPSGDLPRKDLLGRLRARRARLTVLISDTCDLRSVTRMKAPVTYSKPPPSNPVLMSLLLQHAGVADISGDSRDQFGWYTADTGGWFTEALVNILRDPEGFPDPQEVGWEEALTKASEATSKLYRRRKKEILDNPEGAKKETLDYLKKQSDQRPQAFQMEVKRVKREGASAAPARILIRVAEGARLFIDGKLTRQRGPTRRFETPALPAGSTFYYTVRLEPISGEGGPGQSRRIAVRAGEATEVDMTAESAARRLPQPPGGSWAVPDLSVGATITVNEKGRLPEQCQVQANWAERNGRRILQVRSVASGEMITVIPQAQRGLFRVYRWGQSNTPPPGVPTPPESPAARTG